MHTLTAQLLSLLLFALPFAPGWLGVYLAADEEAPVVSEVIPDSPAAKAGIAIGDRFLSVGDEATPTRDQFIAAVRKAEDGSRVRFEIQRGASHCGKNHLGRRWGLHLRPAIRLPPHRSRLPLATLPGPP